MQIEAGAPMADRYYQALRELLWQLADDDLVVAHRASEWLGLASHVEADVAFSSIAQDEMGHAAMYFELLEALGEGSRDDLAHLRSASDRRNARLLEEPNGIGSYLLNPHFDWAFTIVRHYLYDVWETVRLESLVHSSYVPLAEVATKAIREEAYHLAHQELWMRRLASHNTDTRDRLQRALVYAGSMAGDLADVSDFQEIWSELAILPQASALPGRWHQRTQGFITELGLAYPDIECREHGRRGEHSQHLGPLLNTLSEVYRSDPAAKW